MKSLGARAGVSDLILVHGGRIHCLELKAVGGPTDARTDRILRRHGTPRRVAAQMPAGLDAALATLESWGLLIGRAS